MASFGWKRKAGEKVSKAVLQQFEDEAEKADEGASRQHEDVDWLHATKRRREMLLEDCATKSQRLKDEGALLAEQGRHWDAIKKWDEAIQLTPENPSLYEMKSQAVRSFQIAIHLCPSEVSLWQEDLQWACRLQKHHLASKEKDQEEDETKRQILNAPELEQDFDFESEEVVAACEAVAQRQNSYEELKRTALVIDTQGNIQNVLAGEGGSADSGSLSKEVFVKARGL
ncbi:tetratricopeptide repeat protein 33 isoform X2 [Boleophthalmus pectinirostris]|uniref:tetratricopeptide repeat protein 33 isoform X2 n=1 Tax=Boleophthalmus pectinirostris TaxID=150288 RepID=UPI00242B3371|nr:tetratricopeptide repeat protein 33 isoform X2 [Boleophthalmus pectinirostris]